MLETYRKVTRLLVPTRCQPGEQGPPRGGDLSAHHSHGASDVPHHLLPKRGGRVERVYTLRGAMPRRFLQYRQGEGTQGGLHHGAPHAWPQWAVPSPSASDRHERGVCCPGSVLGASPVLAQRALAS